MMSRAAMAAVVVLCLGTLLLLLQPTLGPEATANIGAPITPRPASEASENAASSKRHAEVLAALNRVEKSVGRINNRIDVQAANAAAVASSVATGAPTEPVPPATEIQQPPKKFVPSEPLLYLKHGGDALLHVTIVRSGTTPPFLIAAKQAGTNSDFLTARNAGPNDIRPVDPSQWNQFKNGVYQNGHGAITALFQMVLLDACASGNVCAADVGANAGFYTQLFLAMGCRVRTMEIQKELVQLIQAGARLNNADDRLVIQNVGAWNEASETHIAVGNDQGGNTEALAGKKDGLAVSLRPLDTALPDSECTSFRAMKLDVEGAEIKAIAGMAGMLANRSVDNILFEFGGKHWLSQGQTPSDGAATLTALLDAGYVLHLIDLVGKGTSRLAQAWNGKPVVHDTARFGGDRSARTFPIPRSAIVGLAQASAASDINLWAHLPRK